MYNHVKQYQQNIKHGISSLLIEDKDPIADFFEKSDEGEPIGTVKKYGDRQYVKTAAGWKYKGKGGSKTQENEAHLKGGGHRVDVGSRITTKKGLAGEVKHVDDNQTHIEARNSKGQRVTHVVNNDELAKLITSGKLTHHIKADQVGKIVGKATKETSSRVSDHFKKKKKIESIGKDPSQIETMDDAFDHMIEFFKHDKMASQTVELLQTALEGSKVKFDPKMKFDSSQILGLSHPDGRIGINLNSSYKDTEELYRTLLHETVHAATRYKINKDSNLRDELTDVLNYVKEQAKKDGAKHYGLTNVHEMVAEIFSNKEFFDYLKSMKVGKDSVIKKILLSIVAAFSASGKVVKKVNDSKEKDLNNVADYLVKLVGTEVKRSAKVKFEKSEKVYELVNAFYTLKTI